VTGEPVGSSRFCSVEGCSRPISARGLCKPHYARADYARHRDTYIATAREWYAAHTERAVETAKAWRIAHPWETRSNNLRKRTAQRIRAAGTNAAVDRFDLRLVYARDDGICQVCLEPVSVLFGRGNRSLEFDHTLPIELGGGHTMANLQVTHSMCNRRKGNWIYLRSRGSVD
jgi:5-methylcytosine-specific restriction endonuclease McrA